jgi:hypothetical protein
MIRRRQFLIRAGSLAGLPFLFSISSLWAAAVKPSRQAPPVFEEFTSSCIDLGRYVPESRELTVRFTGRKPDRFYRYSNVPPEIWEKLRAPFEVLTIQEFKVSKPVQTNKVKKQ